MRFAGRRQFLRMTTAVVATALVFPSLARAQTSAVDQFIANPAQALQNFPNGGAQLISLIRDVAVAHPEALNAIIALLKNASADQQSAIGSGLGQAAQIVVRDQSGLSPIKFSRRSLPQVPITRLHHSLP